VLRIYTGYFTFSYRRGIIRMYNFNTHISLGNGIVLRNISAADDNDEYFGADAKSFLTLKVYWTTSKV